MVQSPSEQLSPLKIQAEALAHSPSEVRYEFITKVISDFGISFEKYIRFTAENQRRIALDAYYFKALTRAAILHRGDRELTDILNTFAPRTKDAEEVVLEFERAYHLKYGSWPSVVPVDVDALIERMLSTRTIR